MPSFAEKLYEKTHVDRCYKESNYSAYSEPLLESSICAPVTSDQTQPRNMWDNLQTRRHASEKKTFLQQPTVTERAPCSKWSAEADAMKRYRRVEKFGGRCTVAPAEARSDEAVDQSATTTRRL